MLKYHPQPHWASVLPNTLGTQTPATATLTVRSSPWRRRDDLATCDFEGEKKRRKKRDQVAEVLRYWVGAGLACGPRVGTVRWKLNCTLQVGSETCSTRGILSAPYVRRVYVHSLNPLGRPNTTVLVSRARTYRPWARAASGGTYLEVSRACVTSCPFFRFLPSARKVTRPSSARTGELGPFQSAASTCGLCQLLARGPHALPVEGQVEEAVSAGILALSWRPANL